MLKIGVFGAGHLGKIHIQQWKEVSGVELVGFYDPAKPNPPTTIAQYNTPRYNTELDLIKAIDAADVVSTTTTHYDVAKKCLLNGKHLFIEKPLAHTLEEALELVTRS